MKPGDVVNIFHDPITKKNLEGKAILVEQVRADDRDGLNMWMVHFPEDYPEENYLRTIFTGEPS